MAALHVSRPAYRKNRQAWNVLSKEPHVGVEFVMTPCNSLGYRVLFTPFHAIHKKSACSTIFCGYRISATDRPRLNKLKTLRQDARTWLLKYPEPPLPACYLRRSANPVKHRITPRCLAYAYRKRSSAITARNRRRYNQPEVTDAVNALLALDP